MDHSTEDVYEDTPVKGLLKPFEDLEWNELSKWFEENNMNAILEAFKKENLTPESTKDFSESDFIGLTNVSKGSDEWKLFEELRNQVLTYTVEFKAHSEASWGCRGNIDLNWSVWKIIEVYEGKQAQALKIEVGDQIMAVDDEKLDENSCSRIYNKLHNGIQCKVTFQRINLAYKLKVPSTSTTTTTTTTTPTTPTKSVVTASYSKKSCVVPAKVDDVWKLFRPLDFKFWNYVKHCKPEKKEKELGDVGGHRDLTYDDDGATKQRIQITELSDDTRTVAWRVIQSDPSISYTSVNHRVRIFEVSYTEDDKPCTFVEWCSDFSNDASAGVVLDSDIKKTDLFKDLLKSLK